MADVPIATLIDCFGDLTNPRRDRRKCHLLLDVVVIGLCAIISGGAGFTEIEAEGQAKRAWRAICLELQSGIPSHDTFGHVFAALDPQEFDPCWLTWVRRCVALLLGTVVPIDGKTVRGSHDAAHGQAQVALVSAWAHAHGVTLGQVKVSPASNEMTAVPALLRLLDLQDCIVTVDAFNCPQANRGAGAGAASRLRLRA